VTLSGVKTTCTPFAVSTSTVGCEVGRSIDGSGSMKKLADVGEVPPTVTVAWALAEPEAFMAVSVY
jgi:hypothetical protein